MGPPRGAGEGMHGRQVTVPAGRGCGPSITRVAPAATRAPAAGLRRPCLLPRGANRARRPPGDIRRLRTEPPGALPRPEDGGGEGLREGQWTARRWRTTSTVPALSRTRTAAASGPTQPAPVSGRLPPDSAGGVVAARSVGAGSVGLGCVGYVSVGAGPGSVGSSVSGTSWTTPQREVSW